MPKKSRVSTEILLLIITIILLSLFFTRTASPLGIYIYAEVTCEQTGEPIEGLEVTLSGMGYGPVPMLTNAEGVAGPWGSGLIDGTYVIEYFWCECQTVEVTINCSKIDWWVHITVPNPRIIKHSYYDTKYFGGCPPVVGLNYTLFEDGVPVAWNLSDQTGTVVFDGHIVRVCHEYQLGYTWGGTQYLEPSTPIHFGCPPECLVYEFNNFLEPKSGGGKNIVSVFHTLAESVELVSPTANRVIRK
jgi:hypothetical protein